MIDLIKTFDHIADHNLYSGKCKCQRKSGPPFNNGDDHLDGNANSDHDEMPSTVIIIILSITLLHYTYQNWY